MPKKGKRSNKRRGSSSERRDGAQRSDASNSNASGDASQDELSSQIIGEAETAPTIEPSETVETKVDAVEATSSIQKIESPSKEDQILDPTGVSPFLTPSGLAAKQVLPANSSTKDVELVFSPGSDADVPLATEQVVVADAVVSESPVPIMGDSPETTQTVIRQSPPINTGLGDDDLLRQSVDLSGIPVPETPANPSDIPKSAKASPSMSAVKASGTTEDGAITVTVEALEVSGPVSPKTDRSGSIPMATTSPVPYPKSPSIQLPTLSGTPKVIAVDAPLSPSVGRVGGTPLVSSVVIPGTPSVMIPSSTPKVALVPETPSVVLQTATTPKVGDSSGTPKVASVVIPESAISPANPPAPAVAVMEDSSATQDVTPATGSLSIPPVPIAVDPNPRSMSRDRISAFISATDAASPPRGTGLDSLALLEDPSLVKLSGVEPVPVTVSSAGPEAPFMPIDFETAIVRLTGRTGKSMDQTTTGGASKPEAGIFGACKTCFGFRKSVALAKDLGEDRDMQTTLLSTPFDPQFEIHRRMLQTVFSSLTGEPGSSVALKGEHWVKQIGFRSADPAEDVNKNDSLVNGVIHVLSMLYLIEEFRADIPASFSSSFAATSIEISGAVLNLAKAGKLNALYNKQRQVIHVTCHVYAGLMKRCFANITAEAVIAQAQSETGLNELLDSVPFPERVVASSK